MKAKSNKDRLFTCRSCYKRFSVKESILHKYPGWTPKMCLRCKDAEKDYEDSDDWFGHPGHPSNYGDN